MSKKIKFEYIDSLKTSHQLSCNPLEYNSLMELISDQCLEDWGDCKGRAWCATCHVGINAHNLTTIDEEHRLQQLSNRRVESRLACQIPLNELLNSKTLTFLGDD